MSKQISQADLSQVAPDFRAVLNTKPLLCLDSYAQAIPAYIIYSPEQ